MKATFQRGGVLTVYPENTEEAENLSRWLASYQKFSGEALLQVITEYPVDVGMAKNRNAEILEYCREHSFGEVMRNTRVVEAASGTNGHISGTACLRGTTAAVKEGK